MYKIFHRFSCILATLLSILSMPAWAQEWQVVENAPGWDPREFITTSEFNGQLYLAGGRTQDASLYFNDLWQSTNGIDWTQTISQGPWLPSARQQLVVFSGKIFLVGGFAPAINAFNDELWYSEDAISWNKIEETPWTGRIKMYAFKDKIYAISSEKFWESSTGIDWSEVEGTVIPPLPQQIVVASDYVYYFYNSNVLPWRAEILASGDGITWSSIKYGNSYTDPFFSAVFAPSATVSMYVGRMWLCAGTRYDGENFVTTDVVYSSSDGTEWERMEDLPQFNSRADHDAVVFDNKLWLLGGEGYNGPPRHAIVYLEVESSEGDSEEGEAPIEGQLEGEGVSEGEGGELLTLPEQLLSGFPSLSGEADSLSFASAQGQIPSLTQEAFNALDSDGSGALQVSELLEALGGVGPVHRADLNGSGAFELSETLRFIQAYNSQGYHCAANAGATEDGFDLGVDATQQACVPHAGDYDPQDWAINLSELLRLVQLYNADGYAPCPAGEDGFCPAGD
jgi:hypothetical protein